MNILIICNCTSGLKTFRGMLINRLLKDGNDVDIIVPYSEEIGEIDAENKLEKVKCNLIRIPMERRGTNPMKDIKLLAEYKKIIKEKKADMVITYTIKPNVYGGMVCRAMGVPYVVNVTGLGTAFQKNDTLQKLVTVLYKMSVRRAKVVFFENIEDREIMLRHRIIKKEKTCVLDGAGVDLRAYPFCRYPEENKTIRFLFMGRVMKEKGIDELFDAMKLLIKHKVNCTLDVLGEPEEDYKEKIDEYEKEGWLHYYGYQNDVKPFIKRCHCFVLPSYHEGMANTNLECAAMGRPVITSRIHGCMEAVIENKTGLLCSKEDTGSLYKAMKKFCNLPLKKKRDMGKAGHRYMVERFDKNKVVEKTIERMEIDDNKILLTDNA